jgi:uncharacterized protein YndB with AHSA1/START domain
MKTTDKSKITVEASIKAPVEKVWQLFTEAQHIVHWNKASDDWHTSFAENDLKPGGRFMSRMEARDGSVAFDFSGTYDLVEQLKQIGYVMDDDRKAHLQFVTDGKNTIVTVTFEVEQTNSEEMQRTGWQAIMDNFGKYVEASDKIEILHFEIYIQANAEQVYNTMLNEKTYREWTAVFNPTSRFEGSWKKGSKIVFLGSDNEGNQEGMVSWIKENIPNKYVSIEHRGIIKQGNEIFTGPGVDEWAGALENYTFTEIDQHTLLSVDMDSNQKFKPYFVETWPKALAKIKAMCEGK